MAKIVVRKQNINIKGTKDGLLFILKEDCSFEEIISELKDKFENSHQSLLDGPRTKVKIKTGYRVLNKKQRDVLEDVFKTKNNLFIDSIECELERIEKKLKDQVIIKTGTIRSGQVCEVDGSILFIGDINPGGSLIASGNIYVIGCLKGIAHAGTSGEKDAIIVASEMEPIQLRIVDVVRNKFEREDKAKNINLYAYVKDERIVLDKHHKLLNLNMQSGL